MCKLGSTHKRGLLHCILRGINAMHQQITDGSSAGGERRTKNAVRMFSYLLNLIVVASEDETLTTGNITGTSTSGKGSKAKKKAAAAAAKAGGNWDWSAQRVGCIKGIEKIVGTFFVLSVLHLICLN